MKLYEIDSRELKNSHLFANRCWHYLVQLADHDIRMLDELHEEFIRREWMPPTQRRLTFAEAFQSAPSEFDRHQLNDVTKECRQTAHVVLLIKRPKHFRGKMPKLDHIDIWRDYSEKDEMLETFTAVAQSIGHYCKVRQENRRKTNETPDTKRTISS